MRPLFPFLCLLLVANSTNAQSQLPACQGNSHSRWNNCTGRWLNTNGDKYEGEWRDGKPSAFGIQIHHSIMGNGCLVTMMVEFSVLALIGAVWKFGTFALTGALLACIGALTIVVTLVQMTLVQFCRNLWVWTLTIVFPYLMFSGVWKGRDDFLMQVMGIGVGWLYCLLLFGKVNDMRGGWT